MNIQRKGVRASAAVAGVAAVMAVVGMRWFGFDHHHRRGIDRTAEGDGALQQGPHRQGGCGPGLHRQRVGRRGQEVPRRRRRLRRIGFATQGRRGRQGQGALRWQRRVAPAAGRRPGRARLQPRGRRRPEVVDPTVLAKIFDSKITTWNDPAIAALNPGAKLPAAKIVPVHRSDSSGTTDNFQKFLQNAAPQAWPYAARQGVQGRRRLGRVEVDRCR